MGDSAYGLFMSHFAMLMLWSGLYPLLESSGWPFSVCLMAIIVSCNGLGWFVWRYIDEVAARAFFHRRPHPPPRTFLNESKG
jgi:peptidoglycan/LPS O-acetylase OafA/YrhL